MSTLIICEDHAIYRIDRHGNQYDVLLDFCDARLVVNKKLYIAIRGTTPYAKICIWNGVRTNSLGFHRFILDAPSDMVVDHINSNSLDNRRANLRICTPMENSRNKRKTGNRLSRYKGVSWHNQRNRWSAQITCNGKKYSLGTHEIEEDAAKAYNEAAIRLFGEFAKLNPV